MKYLILSFCTIFILSSCSPVNVTIRPIPEQQRTPIKIQQMEDLTGQYKSLHPSFDSLITLTCSLPMIDVIEEDEYLDDKRQQMTYQNPMRLLSSHDMEKPKFHINGEVELISYGSINNIDNRITAYSFFGLLGFALSRDNDLAAYVQYRIFIKDSTGNLLERFIVSGISSDDPNEKSRKELMSEANLIAAYNLQSQLIQFFIKHGLDAKSQRNTSFSKRYALKHALEYMKNLLNPSDSQNKK